MFNKKIEELIKEIVGIGYKKGYLDGVNAGIEEMSEEEFNECGVSDIIDGAVNKIRIVGIEEIEKALNENGIELNK